MLTKMKPLNIDQLGNKISSLLQGQDLGIAIWALISCLVSAMEMAKGLGVPTSTITDTLRCVADHIEETPKIELPH